jgi:hypothetical protein
MTENPISAEKIRHFVDTRLKQARFRQRVGIWVLHVVTFLFFILGAQPLSSTAMALFVGWLIGIILHTWSVWMESSAGERYVRRLLAAQAVKELYAEVATAAALAEPENEKTKRAEMVTLSDDGELIPIDEAASEADARAIRRSGHG